MPVTLRIVAVNDVYSLANLPRLKTLVRHHAESNHPDAMIVTLAGDFLSPSILSSLDRGRGMVDCMNDVGFTHVTLGNHEDDLSSEDLDLRLRELRAKCLVSNASRLGAPTLEGDVIAIGRVRVGLLGVVMDDPDVYRRPPFAGAVREHANDAAVRVAARMLDVERCTVVVPLTHQTMDQDRALARRAWFPVILGGHEHVVVNEDVEGSRIVKAGMDAAHAVVVDLVWPDEPEGALDRPSVAIRIEDVASYDEDAALRARVEVHMARVHDLEHAMLVHLSEGEVVSSIGIRARQTSMGTLVCSRLRDALGADACLFNAGGIRGAREYRGGITYGDIKNEVPFDNEVVVVKMPGSVVRDGVAASRAKAPLESGSYLQVDDLIAVDAAGAVTAIAGAPLDPGREYAVAIIRDLMTGLDHVEPLVRFAREHPERLPPAGSGREPKVILVEAFSRALYEKLGGFDAVDANHDGVLTEAELEAAIAAAMHEPQSPILAGLVVDALDKNHDHVVTREEAAEAIAGRSRSGHRDT